MAPNTQKMFKDAPGEPLTASMNWSSSHGATRIPNTR